MGFRFATQNFGFILGPFNNNIIMIHVARADFAFCILGPGRVSLLRTLYLALSTSWPCTSVVPYFVVAITYVQL